MADGDVGGAAQVARPEPVPAGYDQLLQLLNRQPADVQWYFPQLPRLLPSFPPDVPLAYMSSLVEAAKHMTLYCGIAKLHRADATMVRAALDRDFMDRRRFKDLFQVVFGRPVDKQVLARLERAEEMRDRVMHGKSVSEADKRRAIAEYLVFATQFNELVAKMAGFRPFGPLTGFKGRGRGTLDKSTTRWLLKGMGLDLG